MELKKMDSIELINSTPLNNYKTKKNLIRLRLKHIKSKSNKFYKKYKKLKKRNTIINVVIATLNATSITTLSIGLTTFPPLLLVSLASTSTSSVLSGMTSVLRLENKISLCYTAFLQLSDLFNEYSNKLFINGVSSTDLDGMLSNLNQKLGLILDATQSVSLEESDASTH